MRRKIIAYVAAAAMALGMLGTASVASAAPKPKPAQVWIIGPVVVDPGGETAHVSAIYRCYVSTHLFVSVKQTGERKRDNALTLEGSSAYVAQTGGGWWQSHPSDFTCDGERHSGTYTIGTFEYGISVLKTGKGWMQFCLASVDPASGMEVEEEFHFQWVNVIGN